MSSYVVMAVSTSQTHFIFPQVSVEEADKAELKSRWNKGLCKTPYATRTAYRKN